MSAKQYFNNPPDTFFTGKAGGIPGRRKEPGPYFLQHKSSSFIKSRKINQRAVTCFGNATVYSVGSNVPELTIPGKNNRVNEPLNDKKPDYLVYTKQ